MTIVAVVASVLAATAIATAFDDSTPCPASVVNGEPLLVCASGTVGDSYSIQLEGRGCPPFTYSVLNGSLPPGMSLSSSGLMSGTPTAAGDYRFWLQLSEGVSSSCPFLKTSEREFELAIDPGLRLVTNSLPQSATLGVPYSAPLQAQMVTNLNPLTGSAPTQPLTWSIAAGVGNGLPPGLSLGQDGIIAGTPTAEGAYTFRVQVATDPAHTSFQTYSLSVRQPLKVTPSRPLATSPAPTLWEVSVPFSAKLTPSGGNGTYTIALAEGALPAGLAVAADGTIAGTPRAAGVSRATIRVTDGEGRTLDYVASFGVAGKLTVATKRLKLGKVDRMYRAKLSTTGGLPPRTWRAISGRLPQGVRFDRKLGVISGIPTKAGIYKVTFEAKDGLRVTATKTLRMIVRP